MHINAKPGKKLGRYAAVSLATLAAAALAGCSGSVSVGGSGLDSAQVEETIKTKLETLVPAGTEITVDCPENIEAKAGTITDCTAKVGDQTLPYKVEQTDDEGKFNADPTMAVIDLDKAQTVIAGQIAEQAGGEWTLTCEPAGTARIYVIAVDGTFTCAASGTDGTNTDEADIKVTVTDLDGNVSWETA